MASADLEEIMREADALPPEEQLRLIAHLAEKTRKAYGTLPMKRQWRELRGATTYPLVGEDAQDWVSRTRKESEGERTWDRDRAS
jgi:hypothetical protein